VLLVVLHLGKVAAFVAAGQAPLRADAAVYWDLGQRIVAGDWLLVADPPEVTRTPGYLLFVAFFQAACGAWALAAAIVVQQLLLLATSLLACRVCWQLTRRRSAVVLCLALTLFCFSAHGVAVNLLSDTLLSFLITLCVARMIAWFQSPSALNAVAIGLVLGAATLVKPIALFAWMPVVAAMALTTDRGLSLGKRVMHAVSVLTATGLLVTPWVIRNEIYFGSPFLTKFGGRALWWSCFRGNVKDSLNPPIPLSDGPATKAIRESAPDVDLHDAWGVYKKLVTRGYSQIDADELMFRAAMEGIHGHPGEFALSRCVRAVWFWITPNGTFRPNTGDFGFATTRPQGEVVAGFAETDEYAGQAAWRSNWYFTKGYLNFLWHPHPLLYAIAAAVTLWGLVFLLRTPACHVPAIFFGLWLLYFSAMTVMAASPEYRYRMILEPTMVIIVTTALSRFLLSQNVQEGLAAGNRLQIQ
jgi:4-amino-4-deoxy-L-arabinose transferase-like glycosyltransferase